MQYFLIIINAFLTYIHRMESQITAEYHADNENQNATTSVIMNSKILGLCYQKTTI